MYSSKIIKAGALLGDTKTLLAHWDDSQTVAANLAAIRRDNVFGKASRSRVEDILAIFRQRYLGDAEVTKALVALAKGRFPAASLDRILYFHAALADPLLRDAVTELLLPMYSQGIITVSANEFQNGIAKWVAQGKATSQWSEETICRVSQGLLATLRDFGVLQGAVNKRKSTLPCGSSLVTMEYSDMQKIGFSTGSIALDDFRRGLDVANHWLTSAVELSALREQELEPLLAALDELGTDHSPDLPSTASTGPYELCELPKPSRTLELRQHSCLPPRGSLVERYTTYHSRNPGRFQPGRRGDCRRPERVPACRLCLGAGSRIDDPRAPGGTAVRGRTTGRFVLIGIDSTKRIASMKPMTTDN